MGNVWFCSDLHLDHKNIAKFRTHVDSPEHNEELIFSEIKQHVTKRDVLYVLGDCAFSYASLKRLGEFDCEKRLIRGNHDDFVTTEQLLEVFSTVEGLVRYKNFWLSHAPVHPAELRGKYNLHGHVHYASIDDPRYLNCCVENILAHWPTMSKRKYLISLQEVREEFERRKDQLEAIV